MLDTATQLEINMSFKKIVIGSPIIELPENVVNDLSTDQAYGYAITKAIHTGKLPKSIANLEIGPVSHSRWLTTANRLCRIWVSKHGLRGKALKNLQSIVEFVVAVYFPCWFKIKVNHSWIEGPRHILYQLRQIRSQQQTVKDIVLPVVQRSAWYAFPELVIQTLICSPDPEERKAGVETIMKIRNGTNKGNTKVRLHKVPEINVDATTLQGLIDFSKADEPPLTCGLNQNEILEFINTPMIVPDWPCHGQSIERCVKQVTEAAATVYSFEKRDGRVKVQQMGRRLMSKNQSKIDLADSIK